MDGFYTPKNGKTYAHTGVMGYGRIRWVDMDAYEAAATATRSSPAAGGQGGGDDLSAQLARLLMGLDLTAPLRGSSSRPREQRCARQEMEAAV